MLLVDFNLAEHLKPDANVKGVPIERTVSCVSILIRKLPDSYCYQGTPLFIARAVERGGPMPAFYAPVPGIPESPGRYAEVHPDRVERFPGSKQRLLFDPDGIDESQSKQWRHELEHDAESVFWLLLYWAMVVQPQNLSFPQPIDLSSWARLLGHSGDRHAFVRTLSDGAMPDNLTHSFYKPLHPLIKDLAAILVIDGHHLKAPDLRKDKFYVTEAFQRLILKFIIENRGEQFMDHPVEKTFRREEGVPHSNGKSATGSQAADSAVRSGMRHVCGSVNFCLFLLSCLRVRFQATDEDVNMADVIVPINTEGVDDTEMVDV
jgi:hypothetical protein